MSSATPYSEEPFKDEAIRSIRLELRPVRPYGDTVKIHAYLPDFGEVGWMHLSRRNPFQNDQSRVIHIFVCETYRRWGIATLLWSKAVSLGLNPVASDWTTPDGDAFLAALHSVGSDESVEPTPDVVDGAEELTEDELLAVWEAELLDSPRPVSSA